MPYITKEAKTSIHHWRDPRGAETPGELNYLLTLAVLSYWRNSKQNYQAINDIVGALEGCKAEFQRRIVAPYEDQKIKENGDVYGEGVSDRELEESAGSYSWGCIEGGRAGSL